MASRECSLVGCYSPHYSLGWCRVHYRWFAKTGKPRDPRPALRDRLFSKLIIEPETGCLLWTGHRQNRGYGHMYVAGRGEQLTHRLMWELMVGPVPADRVLDHVKARGCVNRHCASIAHLEVVTIRENTLRGETLPARNAAKTHCDSGHEFDLPNTRFASDGSRACRECHRDSDRRRRAS